MCYWMKFLSKGKKNDGVDLYKSSKSERFLMKAPLASFGFKGLGCGEAKPAALPFRVRPEPGESS